MTDLHGDHTSVDNERVDYDPFSAATLADPMAAYAELRANCPVHFHENFSPPFFTVTRHDDAVEILRDVELWSSRYGQTPQYSRGNGLGQDPPEHTEFRRLFQKGFTPRMIGRLEEEIEELGNALIDDMLVDGRTEGDFHDLYACPLPIIVIAKLLGIPPSDLARFKVWSDALVATFNDPDPRAPDQTRGELEAYFQTHIDERHRLLRDAGVTEAADEHLGTVIPNDLVSGFVVAEYQGRRLNDAELHRILIQLLLGGNETTTSLLTNLLVRLMEDRGRWEAVCRDPALIEIAVEESLRFDPPVLGLFRTNLEPTCLRSVDIPLKSKVMVTYASANRDPDLFDDPDEFRLDRSLESLRGHLSFGFGHHYCPGTALARLEGRVSLRLLANRLPDLRIVGEPERIAPFNLWGKKSLPVAWGATAGVH